MPVVNVNGCDLYFSDWGDPDGRPVVLLHAFGLSGHMWSQQVPDLTEAGLRCVTYDRRGHGRSDQPATGYDLDTLADDLAGLIDHLGLEDVVVVGHSMGASETVRYLTRHGAGRVAGIVLSAPCLPALLRTPANLGGADPAVFAEARRTMRADLGAWLARTTDEEYFGPAWPMAPDLGVWTRQQLAGTPLPVLLACHHSFTEADLRAELGALDVPVLVVHGDADTSCPLEATGRLTAALVAHSQLAVIDGAGHGLYASAARRYNETLLAFVAGCPTAHGASAAAR